MTVYSLIKQTNSFFTIISKLEWLSQPTIMCPIKLSACLRCAGYEHCVHTWAFGARLGKSYI